MKLGDTQDIQNRTPIIDAMLEFRKRLKDGFVNLCGLGHKFAHTVDSSLRDFWGSQALDSDYYPRLCLDCIETPRSHIKESLELTRELYKTKWTFFSPSGTSPLNTVMICSTISNGDKILVARHSHKSVFWGIYIAGAIPVYLETPIDDKRKILLNTTYEAVEDALNKNPDIKAVHLSSPTMYGFHIDLPKIEKLVHSRNIALLVDEAWGSLMPFCDKYPKSAIEIGADLVIQSNHKDGPAVVGSGLLHVCTDRIPIKRVQMNLNRVLSTSPSAWVLSSHDAARKLFAQNGYEICMKAMENASYARKEVNQIPGFYVPGNDMIGRPGVFAYSPNRVVVFVEEQLGLTGWEMLDILNAKYNIGVMGPALHYFVPSNTYSNSKEDWAKFINALKEISKDNYSPTKKRQWVPMKFPRLPQVKLPIREAYDNKKTKLVPIDESLNKVIASLVCAYPPGMAMIMEGEIMTQEILDFIKSYIEAEKTGQIKCGQTLAGLEDNNTKIPIFE
jgi:arginine decarboxylase